jgi:hypothetical protein
LKSRPSRWARDGPRGAFRFPILHRDSKKSGQSGSDVPAPREAQYLCMRERGNGTDGLESPEAFRTKCGAHKAVI